MFYLGALTAGVSLTFPQLAASRSGRIKAMPITPASGVMVLLALLRAQWQNPADLDACYSPVSGLQKCEKSMV